MKTEHRPFPFPEAWEPDLAARETERRLRDEQRATDAAMAYDLANLRMPEDIRSAARRWRLEAWAEVLWNSAFQAGYREAMRDRGGARDGE